ncbi:MAG: hypothetical protein NVSMB1_15770 [Polyangiales bacterium]
MTGLSKEARAIVDAGRGGDDPDQQARLRVRSAMMRRIGVGAAVASTAAISASTSAVAAVASVGGAAGAAVTTVTTVSVGASVGMLFGKAALAIALLGTAFGGYAYVHHQRVEARARVAAIRQLPANSQATASSALDPHRALPLVAPSIGVNPMLTPDEAIDPDNANQGAVITSPFVGALVHDPSLNLQTTPAGPSKTVHANGLAVVDAPAKVVQRDAISHAVPDNTGGAKLSVPTIEEELAVLREVHLALRNGDAARALALLEKSTGVGALAEERDAARILASCMLHRDEAPAQAARFLAARPTSPMCDRIRNACRIE